MMLHLEKTKGVSIFSAFDLSVRQFYFENQWLRPSFCLPFVFFQLPKGIENAHTFSPIIYRASTSNAEGVLANTPSMVAPTVYYEWIYLS